MSEVATASESPATPSTVVKDEGASSGDEEKEVSGGKKSRRELPAGAVATLKAWLLSPEHFTHPYPTPQDQVLLMAKTGIDKKQLKNWFTNARRRIWKPMLKKQLEQGKMAHHATTAGGMVLPPAAPAGNPDAAYVALQHHYQNRAGTPQPAPPSTNPAYESHAFPGASTYPPQQQLNQTTTTTGETASAIAPLHHPHRPNSATANASPNPNQSNISYSHYSVPGALPPPPGSVSTIPPNNMNKTDSHAVLMELFARDQDLVRQATEGARHRAASIMHQPMSNANNANDPNTQHLVDHTSSMINKHANNNSFIGTQHPMKTVSTHKLTNVPSINSWPHFSSVSSLNNLGTLSGVRSITNLSGADLVSQGSLNKKGNLAQVKSIECMGRADSYAFLEVFFDNPSSQRGIKREREEDNDVGLCLDADETPNSSSTTLKPNEITSGTTTATTSNTNATSMMDSKNDKEGLKRAYDDALAARGLISVSRSSEKLTDLALPAKMQRTLSQEYLKSMGSVSFSSFSFQNNQNNNPDNAPVPAPASSNSAVNQNRTQPGMMYSQQQSQQYPGQPPQQQYASSTNSQSNLPPTANKATIHHNIKHNHPSINSSLSDPSSTSPSVEVPSTTKCALCQCINVDTQLRPCGHMFHGRCLKPSLQNALGPPKCPIDNIPMQSAVLAVPTDDNSNTSNNTGASVPYQASSSQTGASNAVQHRVKTEQ